jgi:fatty-acyl-CoA synthase
MTGTRPRARAAAGGQSAVLQRPPTFADLIARALGRYGNRPAFVEENRVWTYRQAADLVGRLARLLGERGLERGKGTAVLSVNRPESWFFQAASLIAGCRMTPLHPLGSLDDHAFCCSDAEVDVLGYDPAHFDDRAQQLREAIPGLRLMPLGPSAVAPDAIAQAEEVPATPLQPAAVESDIAWLTYTGGTTGRPKGVMLPHRCMVQNTYLTLMDMQWPTAVRLLLSTPITHSAGTFILPALLRGGTVVMTERFDAAEFCRIAAEQRITATLLVPSALYRLLERPDFNRDRLRHLESVFYGSSPMSPRRMVEALDRFGPIFNQLYGQAEAPNTITHLRKEDHDPVRPERLASCGQAFLGVEVTLHNTGDHDVGAGEPGEICVRGPLVMDGYWKRPRETADALRNGWLHTGDIGVVDSDGYFSIVDRVKEMIISGGFNVYPREVEDVLTAHPGVALAAVIGVPDDRWGESVKAFVVRRRGENPSEGELREFVRDKKGPVYAPKTFEFLGAIPLTAVGKPDKKALRAAYWQDEDRQVR